jgi:hypothetical protein
VAERNLFLPTVSIVGNGTIEVVEIKIVRVRISNSACVRIITTNPAATNEMRDRD